MGALNSEPDAIRMTDPFLEYLTVFRARLGAVNIVLGLTGLSHLPEETLLRKTRQILDKKISLKLAEPKNESVFAYLKEKALIPDSANPRDRGGSPEESSRGRYKGFGLCQQGETWCATHRRAEYGSLDNLDQIPVFQTDVWMSDPRLRSTIGVPTPDNVREIVDFTFQLRLLSRGKVTWTSAGYLIHSLRRQKWNQGDAGEFENPFLLGLDGVALLRQLVACDGILIRELLRVLCTRKSQSGSDLVTRDDIAAEFPSIVRGAVDQARNRFPASTIYKATQFRKSIERTAGKRAGQSRGPGVVEHRVSPRLEWLVDLGYLSKRGLSKNGFAYRIEPSAASLLADLDTFIEEPQWAESVAIAQWRSNPIWDLLRPPTRHHDRKGVVLNAYQLLQKPIGPSPLNDVAFISAMLLPSVARYSDMRNEIIGFAQKTDGVTLSGGRTQRTPENIYVSDKVLRTHGQAGLMRQ